jgi:hypothetical protein
MGSFAIGVLSSLAAAVLTAIAGFAFRKRLFREKQLLPIAPKETSSTSYTHLNGDWHVYYITQDPAVASGPYWRHGTERLAVDAYKVQGRSQVFDLHAGAIEAIVHGEIRHGTMILTDVCVQDESDFASVIYADLRSTRILVGMWIGFDGRKHPTAGPIILTRKTLKAEDLGSAVSASTINFAKLDCPYPIVEGQPAENGKSSEAS